MSKREKTLLILTFVLFVCFRLYPLFLPSWYEKELVQVNMAENLAKEHFNIFKNSLSFNLYFLSPDHELPIRWCEDFPLFNLLASVGIQFLPLEPLLVGRILSFIFFLAGSFFLFQFVKENYSIRVAYWSVALFSLSPITLAYSTYFISDMAMVTFFLASLYGLRKNYYFSLLCAICFTVTRYYGVFLLLPLLGYAWSHFDKKNIKFYLLFMLPPLVEGLWLIYTLFMFEHPIGGKWHWGEWQHHFLGISKYGVTFLGFLFLCVGFFKYRKNLFFILSLVMIFLSLGFLTQGHDIHWFYEFQFIPFLVIATALGWIFFLQKLKHPFAVSLCFVLALSWLSLRESYKLMRFDSSPKILGEKLETLSQSQDKLLVMQDVPDPGVFVYGKREGWMVNFEDLLTKESHDGLYQKATIGVVRISEGNLLKNIDKTLPWVIGLKQKYLTLWEEQGNFGMHQKCGAINFFFNHCPREK